MVYRSPGTSFTRKDALSPRRFARCMAEALGRRPVAPRSPLQRVALRCFLRTWSPRYDPAKIELPAGVQELLDPYSAMAS